MENHHTPVMGREIQDVSRRDLEFFNLNGYQNLCCCIKLELPLSIFGTTLFLFGKKQNGHKKKIFILISHLNICISAI